MSKYTKALDAIAEQAGKQADALITQVRRELLIPYCDRTGLRFTAGMGSWSFDKKGITYGSWDADFPPPRVPKRLYEFLQSGYPTNPHYNDCGSMMLDYTPLSWKDEA